MSLATGIEQFVRTGEPLAPHTWFQIGGPADFFAAPSTLDDVAELVRRGRDEQAPIRLLGGGSNILVGDEGVPGVVMQLAGEWFGRIEVQGRRITAGGGAKLGHVVSCAVREGLSGLETLVGIPGTIGGALHNNSGGRGGDIGQWTCQATVMTRGGEVLARDREDLVFEYRKSSLDELVILEATFELEEDDPVELTKRMQKQWILKKAAQPMAHQSAGCIFKNPRGLSAGTLVEQAGLKGTKIGKAMVSERHANFIVAEPGCSSRDVLRLIELVETRVQERLGVELEREIEVW